MEKLIGLESIASVRSLFGVEDTNLKILEEELQVKIELKPQGLVITGEKAAVRKAVDFIYKIAQLENGGFVFSREEIARYLANSVDESEDVSAGQGIKVPSRKKRFVSPETKGQEEYIASMDRHDIVFCTGPAGTGKTYLAMAMAVNYLTEKKVRRIILTRPAIEAGESLGFLPGTMQEKLGPYLRPLYDALYDMMEAEVIEEYLDTGVIEIVPLAYMRGRTPNNAFVILDEAQNCTGEQIDVFLTRLGFDSKR